jgi:hypothetical protein
VVYFNEASHNNLNNFSSGQGILQAISQDEGDWETFPKFVRTSRGSGGPDTPQF